jgi:hypothetical protein
MSELEAWERTVAPPPVLTPDGPRFKAEPEHASAWWRVIDTELNATIMGGESDTRCALYAFALNAFNDDLELVAVVSRFQVIPSAGGRAPRFFEDPAKAKQ